MAVRNIEEITPEMVEEAQKVFSEGASSASREENSTRDPAAELGATISDAMVKKGITLEEVAKQLGTSTDFVSQCLNRHGVHDYSAE